jgi:VanZ family protein
MRDALMGIRLDPRYALLTLVWTVAIYLLSSRVELGTGDSDPAVALVSNLLHVPLFAGLAFCLLKTLSGGQEIPLRLCGVVFLVAAGYAALDEWHQSFVPGRFASVGDFLLDITGIVATILILRWKGLRAVTP